MTQRYCTHCGAPITEGNRFCGQCGQPVQPPAPAGNDFGRSSSPPPPPPPPSRGGDFSRTASPPPPPPASRGDELRRSASPPAPAQAGEQILGIVALGKPKGLMGMRQDAYNMIVTPSRLVFAYVSPELMKQATKQAREQAKQQGKGFLGQWGAQLAWLDLLHRHYHALSMDDILARYAGSFVVQNHQVQKVRYKQVRDQESGQSTDELILRTGDGKLRFKLLRGNLREVKQLLRQTLGKVA